VFSVNVDTKKETLVFVFPNDFKGTITAVNADGTLLGGAKSSDEEKELFKKGAVSGSEVRVGNHEDAVVFDWEPTIEAGAELLGARGDDTRFDSLWRGQERVQDQLSEEELARQWEFSVADPQTPAIVTEVLYDAEDVAEDTFETVEELTEESSK